MNKYINADELTEKTVVRLALIKEERKADYDNLETYNGMIRGLVEAQRFITETDTVDIVRCKECKYFNIDTALSKAGDIECGFCEYHECYLLKWGYDYCSRGERRESE